MRTTVATRSLRASRRVSALALVGTVAVLVGLTACEPAPPPAEWSSRARHLNAAEQAVGMGPISPWDANTYVELLQRGWSFQAVMHRAGWDKSYRRSVVEGEYRAILGRAADVGGREAFVEYLGRPGNTRVGLEAELLGSPEHYARAGGNDDAFVKAVVAFATGWRPSESTYWAGLLSSGMPRRDVAAAVLNTSDARHRRVAQAYEQVLGRTAGGPEVAWWAGQGAAADPFAIRVELAASAEFRDRAQSVALPDRVAPVRVAGGPARGVAAVADARTQVGVDYVWGGESLAEGGFDCSGLTYWAYLRQGIRLPRVTYDQVRLPHRIPLDQIQTGDLVFYWGSSHVAMYVGDGMVVNAPRTGDIVRYGSLYMGTPEVVIRVA